MKQAKQEQEQGQKTERIGWIKPRKPVLRFTPTTWAKLLFLGRITEDEVGMLGVAEDPFDLLRITRLAVIKQVVSLASFEFDEAALSDFYLEMEDKGYTIEQYARVLIHTHPSGVDDLSGWDKDTLERYFGRCSWAVSMILPKGGNPKAILRMSVPSANVKGVPWYYVEQQIPVEVDYSGQFEPPDFEAWRAEHEEATSPKFQPLYQPGPNAVDGLLGQDDLAYLDHLGDMEEEDWDDISWLRYADQYTSDVNDGWIE